LKAWKRAVIVPGTLVEGLARLLTALNIGLITYGVVAPQSSDRRRALSFVDGLLR
jgi:hypothetical protein